jgi:hypothetical protein
MSTKLALSAALLLAVLAGPALAGDQDTATELRDSGRYVPEANLPEWNARNNVPSRAYASSYGSAYASAVRPMRMRAPAAVARPAYDFQLDGR